MPQRIQHPEKRSCATEMNKKTKTKPKPGIAGDRFTFFTQVQLPEISGCKKNHKNAAPH